MSVFVYVFFGGWKCVLKLKVGWVHTGDDTGGLLRVTMGQLI